jgi:hypothetical protein
MRIAPAELRSWRRAAKHADVPLAQWVRQLCNTEVRNQDTKEIAR